jgi:hypothetical protein
VLHAHARLVRNTHESDGGRQLIIANAIPIAVAEQASVAPALDATVAKQRTSMIVTCRDFDDDRGQFSA